MKRHLLFLLLFASIAAGADAQCRRGFRTAERAVTTAVPVDSAAWGDFDRDGRTDVVIMQGGQRTVLLNRGGNVFEPLPRVKMSRSEDAIVAATDVNGDGLLDVLYRGGGGISAAIGNGDGAFQPAMLQTPLTTGTPDWRGVDFNRDGLVDFIGRDVQTRRVVFTQAAPGLVYRDVANLIGPGEYVVTGDFDGDGHFDLAGFGRPTGAGAPVSTSFGWNDGSFRFTIAFAGSVELAMLSEPLDVDGDGAHELVGIENGALLIGRVANRALTTQRFDGVLPPGASLQLEHPVMFDTDGDGHRDIVFQTRGSLAVIRRTADQRFLPARLYARSGGSLFPGGSGLALADVDGDGRIDLAQTRGHHGLSVVDGPSLATGQGSISRVHSFGFTVATVQYADVDGDGTGDLIGTSTDQRLSVEVLFGDGAGGFARFAKPLTLTSFEYDGAQTFVGDLDGDGHADLVITPKGTLGPKPSLRFGSAEGFDSQPVVLDADSIVGTVPLDGRSTGLIVVRGQETQLITVSSGRSLSAKPIASAPTVANGVSVVRTMPGDPAQLMVNGAILTRDGDTWRRSVVPFSAYRPAAVDLDADGRMDYLFNGAYVAFGEAGGYVNVPLPPTLFPESVTPADVDGDGRLDLVLFGRNAGGDYAQSGMVQILRNRGGRVFEQDSTTITGAPFRFEVLANDYDGDGRTDLVISTIDGAELLTNTCSTPRVVVSRPDETLVEGTRAKFLIRALPTNGLSVGPIEILEGGVTLAREQAPGDAYSIATVIWSSPPLTAGPHTYTIRYHDSFAGLSETTVSFVVQKPVKRRRPAR